MVSETTIELISSSSLSAKYSSNETKIVLQISEKVAKLAKNCYWGLID